MITLEEIAPYLPYGIKAKHENYDGIYLVTMISLEKKDCYAEHNDPNSIFGHWMIENDIKPILRPLSDLTKEIEHNGERFVPIIELCRLEREKIFWSDSLSRLAGSIIDNTKY